MAVIRPCTGTTADWKSTENKLILKENEIGVEICTDGYANIRQGDGKNKFLDLPIISSSRNYPELESLITRATKAATSAETSGANAQKAYELVKDTDMGGIALKVDNLTADLSEKKTNIWGRVYTNTNNTRNWVKIADINKPTSASDNFSLSFNIRRLITPSPNSYDIHGSLHLNVRWNNGVVGNAAFFFRPNIPGNISGGVKSALETTLESFKYIVNGSSGELWARPYYSAATYAGWRLDLTSDVIVRSGGSNNSIITMYEHSGYDGQEAEPIGSDGNFYPVLDLTTKTVIEKVSYKQITSDNWIPSDEDLKLGEAIAISFTTTPSQAIIGSATTLAGTITRVASATYYLMLSNPTAIYILRWTSADGYEVSSVRKIGRGGINYSNAVKINFEEMLDSSGAIEPVRLIIDAANKANLFNGKLNNGTYTGTISRAGTDAYDLLIKNNGASRLYSIRCSADTNTITSFGVAPFYSSEADFPK